MVRAGGFFEREINWMGLAAETLKKPVDFETGWFKSRPPRRNGPDDRAGAEREGQPVFGADIGALDTHRRRFPEGKPPGPGALQKALKMRLT
jgi:hypothetical protein